MKVDLLFAGYLTNHCSNYTYILYPLNSYHIRINTKNKASLLLNLIINIHFLLIFFLSGISTWESHCLICRQFTHRMKFRRDLIVSILALLVWFNSHHQDILNGHIEREGNERWIAIYWDHWSHSLRIVGEWPLLI